MAFVSQALEWVRALLFGTRAGSKDSRARRAHAHPDQPPQAPAYAQAVPISPAMMSAYLTLARLHRAKRAAQRREVEPRPHAPAYVFPPAQHQHSLQSVELTGAGR